MQPQQPPRPTYGAPLVPSHPSSQVQPGQAYGQQPQTNGHPTQQYAQSYGQALQASGQSPQGVYGQANPLAPVPPMSPHGMVNPLPMRPPMAFNPAASTGTIPPVQNMPGIMGMQNHQGAIGIQNHQGVMGVQNPQGTMSMQSQQGVPSMQSQQGMPNMQSNQGSYPSTQQGSFPPRPTAQQGPYSPPQGPYPSHPLGQQGSYPPRPSSQQGPYPSNPSGQQAPHPSQIGGMAQGVSPFPTQQQPPYSGMPTQMSPGRPMYAPQAAAAPPKISAAQMPNVVAVQEADEARYSSGEGLFRSSVVYDILPPMPTTDVTILDDGNCSSHFMRSTMYHVPNSEDLASSSKLPLSLIVQPFAKLTPRQAPVPVVDFGENGPLRCTRCRAYINVFVTFLRGGRTFECNICSMNNDVPDEYFCNLDASGRRSDIGQRPELLYGTVDFLASKEYIMRKPKPPYLLFVIDTSRSSIQNGAFASALIAIREHIEAHLNDGNARVYQKMGIVTFDKNISIYDLRASEPQILVMSDVHEPFVPLSDGLFFDPLVACEQAFALLDRLPSLFTETRIVDSCLGAAAAFALEAMKSHGGRVVLFNTTLPNVGIGLLRNRDSAAPSGTDKVNPLVLSQGDFYSKIGSQAAALGVSYVLVSTPSGFMDIATIGILVFKFGSDIHGRTLVRDLNSFLAKPFVFDAILRLRAGGLLQTAEYYGNFSTLNQTDYQFGALDCDQSIAVTFMYDGKLPDNEPITFQCAILHTTSAGQRRIRVHNLSLAVTSLVANVFRMADLDSLIQYSCKKAISQIKTVPIPTLVNHFHIRSAQALGSYRKFCASAMPAGQLVLPESLKLLPIFCLAFSKCSAFSASITQIDVRMAALFSMMSAGMKELPAHFYPRLFPLHRLLELPPDQTVPPRIRLSQEFLEPHGIYLLDNGSQLLLWVGSMVDPEALSKIFGVAQVAALPSYPDSLPELANPASQRARHLIEMVQSRYDKNLTLQIIRQSVDPSEVHWQNSMVEDAQGSLGPSYVDFLCRLHNQINHEMNSASLAERTALLSFLQ